MENVKRMSIKEFREKGYLQEANRRFFHPLGLALEVIVDEENFDERLGGIWDYREDPEGIIFDFANYHKDRFEICKKNEEFIEEELSKRAPARIKLLGSTIETID